MSVQAPWTSQHDTSNKSIRQNVARRGVVLHHAAMTNFQTLLNMEVNATKQVSSTCVCKDDQLARIIPNDSYRAWSLSDAYWDSALRSIETCNESTNGWTISARSHEKLAQAVAYWASSEGWYPHRSGDPETWTVLGHREVFSIHGGSYATACPGGMDLDLVTRRAQQILTQAASTNVTPIILEGDSVTYNVRRKQTGGIFNMGDQFVKHMLTPGQATIHRAVATFSDEQHDLNEGQFWDLVDALAIPREEVQENGHVWSPMHDIKALIAKATATK